MRIKRCIVLSLAAVLTTLMLTGCPWDQDRPGGGASSQPGGDGVIVVPPGGDDDDDGDDSPVTYTITATAGPGGTAQPPSQTVAAGQNASVAVAASDGYCIRQITVDGDARFTAADASRTEYTVQFPAVDASHTVEASFAQVYTVTASIGEGGTVKLGDQSVADGDSAAFLADDTLTFTVEPDSGYQIASVQAGGDVLSGENGSYTYTVKGDCTISVTFQKLTYTVTATVNGTGGTASISSEKVEHGDSVTIKVTPDEGYTVGSVRTADGTPLTPNADGTYTLDNVTEDQTITVTFQQLTYTVTVTAGTGGTASVSSNEVEHGGSVTVTVTPDGGYTVGSVQDNGADVTDQVTNNTYTLTNVTADHDITVTFQKLTSRTVFTSEQLMDWAEEVRNGNYSLDCTLAADITLTGNWTPVGISFTNSYTGTFDGNNHTIRGLTVKGSDEYAGLFGYIGSGGTVKNVKLADVQITSDYQYAYVGGVAGNNDGAIENCSVSGSVSGNSTYNSVGGVVGYQWGGSITGCSSSATVNGTGSVGGVVGQTNYGATLTACYSTENVTLESNNSDNNYAGGVVGSNGASGTLTACYATGNVTGTGTGSGSIYVGGVTGDNASGTLTACYHATGDVTGASGSTGGVTGRNFKGSMFGGGIITACYWQNDQEQGIGYNQAGTTDGTTQVTDGDWTDAVAQMNKALSGTDYSYQQGNPPKLN